jgi:hypothetical protein
MSGLTATAAQVMVNAFVGKTPPESSLQREPSSSTLRPLTPARTLST